MVTRWKELKVQEGILYRQAKKSLQALVPRELRVDVFWQMHGKAHVGGHMGRDCTYVRVRTRACWPWYKLDMTRWVRAKPGPDRGRLPLVQERVRAPFEWMALD